MPSLQSLKPARSLTHRKRQYSVRPFYVTLVIFTILAVASYSLGGLSINGSFSFDKDASQQQVWANSDLGLSRVLRRDNVRECRLVRNAKDKCAFVRANCPDDEEGLFSYLQFYYCSLADAKPLAFIILILWLSLLFSTIGIAASDFLCVDLSTLASILGMSESLTGVTFLAFGNGSPDVFSTFAAMRSNSGSLAVGELIGAASFITSVVAGSMALVRPFRVARRSFVRDVGYFVIAVSFSMVLLADGRLHAWESATMVGLYCFYVVMVVTWHWCLVRRRRVYERTVAARSHFHIPDNQELDIEEAAEDDDPGVAAESRSLLRGASTEDFANLERADIPAWRRDEDEDEDDETRNHYLAEIRDNMHIYRPNISRRRNTLNPIRPSLVGALEFQSVLSSLQRSRNIHQHSPINLYRYSDDPNLSPSQQFDNRSVASHPRIGRASPRDRLSPNSGGGSARVRAVSANDAAGLKLDTSVFNQQAPQSIRVTVSRPFGEAVGDQDAMEPEASRIDQSAMLTVSPSSSGFPSRSPSPSHGSRPQTPDLLAPPDAFRPPNYQADAVLPRSPLQVSPRGTSLVRGFSDYGVESPSTQPFPPFHNAPESTSSRAPSIHLPAAATPTELLQLRDSLFDDTRSLTPVRWWPYGILPPPHLLISTLFPTLANWKAKNIWERLLGIVAAPSVLLLTVTLPVVEPAQVETSPEPIPVVVTTVDDGGDRAMPRVRLPEDSPFIQGRDHGSVTVSEGPEQDSKQSVQGRQRWDSELPAVPPTISDSSGPPPKEWNRWLVLMQLFTGPLFIALIGWTSMDAEMKARNFLLPSLCSLLFSLLCVTGLILSTRNRDHSQAPPQWRPFLALLGFVVAISWIATIATEVVNLLKTLGVILNISDSLLGLTVFAVGNSLGDLVADITVARLGYPVMALSACFGGPMLNILLGIGVGGLYMTLNSKSGVSASTTNKNPSYEIAISKVLIISGATLLVTLVGLLIVVPLNKWKMDRKIGWGLVILWSISTLGNVIAEVATLS